MTPQETACLGVGAVVLAYLVWYANQSTDQKIVPLVQGEGQVLGLGFQAGMRANPGTNLEISQEFHGWHPGMDPDSSAQPVIQCRHRYPVVPGGNITYVLHNGWSSMSKDAPADNDWRIAPPEAAIL